jgi:hypothetical protein
VGVTVGVEVGAVVGVGDLVGTGVNVDCGVSVRNGVTVGRVSVGVMIATATVFGSSARPAQPVMKDAMRKRLIIGMNGCF